MREAPGRKGAATTPSTFVQSAAPTPAQSTGFTSSLLNPIAEPEAMTVGANPPGTDATDWEAELALVVSPPLMATKAANEEGERKSKKAHDEDAKRPRLDKSEGDDRATALATAKNGRQC